MLSIQTRTIWRLILVLSAAALLFTLIASLSATAHAAKKKAAKAPAKAEATAAATPKAVPMNCADCHGDILTGEVVHKAVKDWACFSCHSRDTKGKTKPNPNQPDDHPRLLPVDKDNIADRCLKCHSKLAAEIKKAKVKHPALDMGCISCHEPHRSKVKKLLKMKAAPDLCFTCHTDKKGHEKDTTVHGAFADDTSCMNCHVPHVSAEKALLSSPQKSLCLSCHADTVKDAKGNTLDNIQGLLDSAKSKHSPVVDGNCTDCHNPHFTGTTRLLKKEYSSEFFSTFSEKKYALCSDCHSLELATSETTDSATEFRNGKMNLHFFHLNKVRQPTSCSACHNLHAADQPKLIAKSASYADGKKIPVVFTKTATGGSCATACHGSKGYDRAKAVTNAAGR